MWGGFSSATLDAYTALKFIRGEGGGDVCRDDGDAHSNGGGVTNGDPSNANDGRTNPTEHGHAHGCVLFLITHCTGYDISPYSRFPSEQEILLLPGTVLKVSQVAESAVKLFLGVSSYDSIITLRQMSDDDITQTGLSYRAAELWGKGKHSESMSLRRDIALKYPQTSIGLYNRAAYLSHLNPDASRRDLQKSLACALKSIELDP